MYPKVTKEYFEHLNQFGDTSMLPTPTFFYGMRLSDELAVDIDAGKTLLVTLQGIQRGEDGAEHKLQFELNGQSRMVHIAPRAEAGAGGGSKGGAKRQLAEAGNPLHIASPMPGAIVSVPVKAGQKIAVGDLLVSLEAMKMETHIAAEREGVVEKVLVGPGDRVMAKDLLIVLAA